MTRCIFAYFLGMLADHFDIMKSYVIFIAATDARILKYLLVRILFISVLVQESQGMLQQVQGCMSKRATY